MVIIIQAPNKYDISAGIYDEFGGSAIFIL